MGKTLPEELRQHIEYTILPMRVDLANSMERLNPDADEIIRDHIKEQIDQILDDFRKRVAANPNLKNSEEEAKIDALINELLELAYDRDF